MHRELNSYAYYRVVLLKLQLALVFSVFKPKILPSSAFRENPSSAFSPKELLSSVFSPKLDKFLSPKVDSALSSKVLLSESVFRSNPEEGTFKILG